MIYQLVLKAKLWKNEDIRDTIYEVYYLTYLRRCIWSCCCLFTTYSKLIIYPSLILSIDAFLHRQDYDLLSIRFTDCCWFYYMVKKDICHHTERFAMNITDVEALELQATLVNTLPANSSILLRENLSYMFLLILYTC